MAKATVTFGGMNTEQLTSFDAALDKYIESVKSDIDAIKNIKEESVLQGEAAVALENYINRAKESMKVYLEELEEYKQEAVKAKEALLSGASEVAGNINSAADSFGGSNIDLG